MYCNRRSFIPPKVYPKKPCLWRAKSSPLAHDVTATHDVTDIWSESEHSEHSDTESLIELNQTEYNPSAHDTIDTSTSADINDGKEPDNLTKVISTDDTQSESSSSEEESSEEESDGEYTRSSRRKTKKKLKSNQEATKVIRSDVNRPGLRDFFQSRHPFSFTTRSNDHGLANLVVPIYSTFLDKGAYSIRLDPRSGATDFASQKTTVMESTCFFCRSTDTCRCTVTDAFNHGTLLFVSMEERDHLNEYPHPMSRMMHLRYLVRSSEVVLVQHATMQNDNLRCTLMQNQRHGTFSYFHVMHNNTVRSFPIQPEKESDAVLVIQNQDAVACARHTCKSLGLRTSRYNYWSSQQDLLPFESSAKDDGCHLPNITKYMTDFQMTTLVPKKMFTTGMGPLSVDKTNTDDEARADLMGIPGDMEYRDNRYIVAAPLTYLLEDQQDEGTTRNKSSILIRSSDRPSTYLKPSVQCAQPRSFESEVFGLCMISWGHAMVMVGDWLCTMFHIYGACEEYHTFYHLMHKENPEFLLSDPFVKERSPYFERAQKAILASLHAPRPEYVEVKCNCSAKQKKRKRGSGCADETGCYRTNRRNNLHLMSADVFGKEDAQVQGLPLYMLIMRHLLEQKAQRHLFDKRIMPVVPRKCMVDMQQVWPILARLLYLDVIEDGSSTECDCCKGEVWPDTWGGIGCDTWNPIDKTCNCGANCFSPWNPPDLTSASTGTKICIPCIASVLADHTYYVREPFSRKSARTSTSKTPRTTRKVSTSTRKVSTSTREGSTTVSNKSVRV